MAPWAGRVRHGRLAFDNKRYQLPVTPIEGTAVDHALHGTAYLQPWEQLDDQIFGVEFDEGWPFGGRVTQTVELEPGSLRLTLAITAGEVAMPAMVGWHPWFRRRLTEDGPEVQLIWEPGAMYELDHEDIPTGELVPPPSGPWDNCFRDLRGPVILRWPGQLELRLESDCSHWIVFDKPSESICVEPQSGPPDGVNQAKYSLDQRLEAGESLARTFTLTWHV